MKKLIGTLAAAAAFALPLVLTGSVASASPTGAPGCTAKNSRHDGSNRDCTFFPNGTAVQYTARIKYPGGLVYEMDPDPTYGCSGGYVVQEIPVSRTSGTLTITPGDCVWLSVGGYGTLSASG